MTAWIALAFALVLGGAAAAADLSPRAPSLVVVERSCPPRFVSALASLPMDSLRGEIGGRYHHAVEESEVDRTVYNRSPRIMWAFAARGACGIAWGYLTSGEINHERLWKCECYYARMLSFRASTRPALSQVGL